MLARRAALSLGATPWHRSIAAARAAQASARTLLSQAAAARFHVGAVVRTGDIPQEHGSSAEHRALWQELYEHDYQKRARLARFLTAATELVEERKAKRADQYRGGAASPGLDDDFLVHGKEHGGYELPPGSITLEVAKDMARQLSDGQRLRSSSLGRLLDESQAILAKLPNITLIPGGTKVTVVGDLHGSFGDLLKVFELAGWPNEDDAFVFNGDFVDRGDRGVEVAHWHAHACKCACDVCVCVCAPHAPLSPPRAHRCCAPSTCRLCTGTQEVACACVLSSMRQHTHTHTHAYARAHTRTSSLIKSLSLFLSLSLFPLTFHTLIYVYEYT